MLASNAQLNFFRSHPKWS